MEFHSKCVNSYLTFETEHFDKLGAEICSKLIGPNRCHLIGQWQFRWTSVTVFSTCLHAVMTWDGTQIIFFPNQQNLLHWAKTIRNIWQPFEQFWAVDMRPGRLINPIHITTLPFERDIFGLRIAFLVVLLLFHLSDGKKCALIWSISHGNIATSILHQHNF